MNKVVEGIRRNVSGKLKSRGRGHVSNTGWDLHLEINESASCRKERHWKRECQCLLGRQRKKVEGAVGKMARIKSEWRKLDEFFLHLPTGPLVSFKMGNEITKFAINIRDTDLITSTFKGTIRKNKVNFVIVKRWCRDSRPFLHPIFN